MEANSAWVLVVCAVAVAAAIAPPTAVVGVRAVFVSEDNQITSASRVGAGMPGFGRRIVGTFDCSQIRETVFVPKEVCQMNCCGESIERSVSTHSEQMRL